MDPTVLPILETLHVFAKNHDLAKVSRIDSNLTYYQLAASQLKVQIQYTMSLTYLDFAIGVKHFDEHYEI